MLIKKENNRIHFKYLDKAYAIIAVDEAKSTITLDIIKVLEPFRNSGIATKVLKEVFTYISSFFKTIRKFVLNPLPLDTKGLNLEQLIRFYKNFGFTLLEKNDKSTPYLMGRTI